MSTDQPTASARKNIETTRFRPNKTHFFIVAFMLVLCAIAMGFSPWFVFTLIAPLIYAVWIMRVRTTVGPRGITAVYLLQGRKSVSWDNFRGILFDKSGRALAVDGGKDGAKERRFPLPAISFNSLPDLNKATRGLIPDPVTPGRVAENEKVEVFDRNGYSVLKTRDEIEAQARKDNDVQAAREKKN